MRMRTLVFLTFLVTVAALHPFDFIENAFVKLVNKSSDPCDDFYRHACPLGSASDVIGPAIDELMKEAAEKDNTQDSYWKHFEIRRDFENLRGVETRMLKKTNIYLEVYREICENGSNATTPYLEKLASIFFCEKPPCRSFSSKMNKELVTNTECEAAVNALEIQLEPFKAAVEGGELDSITRSMHVNLEQSQKIAEAINLHLSLDVREGIEITKQWVEKMVVIAEEWVEKTPWAGHYNAMEQIKKITANLKIYDNYGKDMEEIAQFVVLSELMYQKCKNEYQNVENGVVFCQVYTAANNKREEMEENFFSRDNAYNQHPSVFFGFPNYYHVLYGNEIALKLGYTGFTVGHEIGHTFIDNFYKPEILPVFSKEAQACITKQYRKTCDEFKEHSCNPGITSLDDDGADIIGLQLAYELLSEHYGKDLRANNERSGVPNDQLFFYAFAYNFCNGTPRNKGDEKHSAYNVRINAAAQHPGFKKAFGCSADSRMMRSATEQCVIYGQDAPETRRKFSSGR